VGRAEVKQQDVRNIDWSTVCPFCGRDTTADYVLNVYLDINRKTSCAIVMHSNPNCMELFFVEISDGGISRTYPVYGDSPDSLPHAIPPEMKRDYAEAQRCFGTECYRACVVMCRRVVQSIVKEVLPEEKAIAVDGKLVNLKEMLKRIRGAGQITQAQYEAGEEVREFGNFGAHPDDDHLETVTKESCAEVLEIVKGFFEQIYVSPARTEKLRVRRQTAENGDAD
jgi:HEPN domain-containing protein